jgi:hypothetical protein
MASTRIPLEQTFSQTSLSVTNSAIPISNLDLTQLITAFLISNPSTNANSVFIGDVNVSITNGIEIPVGSAPLFDIEDVRQLYEIQNPAMQLWEFANCKSYPNPDLIPIICWNPSHWFVIAPVAGPTVVGATFFKSVYN